MDSKHFYVVIERLLPNSQKWEIVPFTGYDGQRLEYHSNDLIYYASSIPLRRCLQFEKFPKCKNYVKIVIDYDRSYLELDTRVKYRLLHYRYDDVDTLIFDLSEL